MTKSKDIYRQLTLDNGVTIVAEPIETVQSISIGLFFHSGVLYEQPKLQGVSHFIEHMLFKGTPTRSAKEIARQFDRIGGYLNAFTAKDYCCYYARVVKDSLEIAVEILADMVSRSVFDRAELERERRVILEEIKMYEDSPDEIIHELLAQNLWRKSPLGRPILGTAHTVGAMSRDEVLEVYQTQYIAPNLIVCAAGNIDWDELVRLVNKNLAHMGSAGVRPRKRREPIPHSAATIFQKDIEQVHLALGATGVRYDDPEKYPITVLNAAFGGGMSSRLFQEIREKRGLAYSVYSYHTSFRQAGLFSIYAGTSSEHLGRVLELIHNELEKVARKGLTKTELADTKTQLKGNMLIGLESTTNRMNRLATGFLYGVPPVPPAETIKPYLEVTQEQVAARARQLFEEKNMAITILSPDEHASDVLARCPFSPRNTQTGTLGRRRTGSESPAAMEPVDTEGE